MKVDYVVHLRSLAATIFDQGEKSVAEINTGARGIDPDPGAGTAAIRAVLTCSGVETPALMHAAITRPRCHVPCDWQTGSRSPATPRRSGCSRPVIVDHQGILKFWLFIADP
jgi:hypothetical protein